MPIYLPRLTVLVALLFAFGASLVRCVAFPFWLALVCSLLFVCLYASGNARRFWWLLVLPGLALIYGSWRLPRAQEHDLAGYAGHQTIIQARIISIGTNPGRERLSFVIEPLQIFSPAKGLLSGRAELLLEVRQGAPVTRLAPGDIVKIRGFVVKPTSNHLPWQADFSSYLSKQSIFCSLNAHLDNVQRQAESSFEPGFCSFVQDKIESIRQQIYTVHRGNLGCQAGGLLTSMVLGERAVQVDPSIVNAFRTVGLSHLIAASGFNLTVVTGISYWLARLFSRSRKFMTFLAFLGMFAFVLLAGISPSVIRAALMCSLFLLAKCTGRSLHGLAALAIALILTILFEPESVADPGCQLSYAATTGIICGASTLAQVVAAQFKKRMARAIVDAALVVVTAQLAVIPIQIYYFWQIGLLFLPANLLVASLVAPVTTVGFTSSLIAALPVQWPATSALIRLLDGVAFYPLQLIIYVAKYFASFEAAVIKTGPPSQMSILFYYLGLFTFFGCLRIKRRQLPALALFILSALSLFFRTHCPPLSIAILPKSTVVFGSERDGCVFGERTAQSERFLAFEGVRADAIPFLRREGNILFDEVLIQSSPCNFSIISRPDNGRDSQKGAATVASRSLAWWFCGHKFGWITTKKPTVRLALLSADSLETKVFTAIEEGHLADWVILVGTDNTGIWTEKTVKLSGLQQQPETNRTALQSSELGLALTVCPHRKVTIWAVETPVPTH